MCFSLGRSTERLTGFSSGESIVDCGFRLPEILPELLLVSLLAASIAIATKRLRWRERVVYRKMKKTKHQYHAQIQNSLPFITDSSK